MLVNCQKLLDDVRENMSLLVAPEAEPLTKRLNEIVAQKQLESDSFDFFSDMLETTLGIKLTKPFTDVPVPFFGMVLDNPNSHDYEIGEIVLLTYKNDVVYIGVSKSNPNGGNNIYLRSLRMIPLEQLTLEYVEKFFAQVDLGNYMLKGPLWRYLSTEAKKSILNGGSK